MISCVVFLVIVIFYFTNTTAFPVPNWKVSEVGR